MPKKMGENTKAVEARERKKNAKQAANEKAAKDAEDKLWADDDKNLAKKKQRKEEEEKKKAEALRKKQENKELLEKEMSSIRTTGKESIQKITRAQIQQEIEHRNKNVELINKQNKPKEKEPAIEENINRVVLDSTVATTVDEAISALSVTDEDGDRHPEKRMKAAFKSFEEANMNRIKLDNPTLKLSQWKQILFKEWQKSPDNPLNKK